MQSVQQDLHLYWSPISLIICAMIINKSPYWKNKNNHKRACRILYLKWTKKIKIVAQRCISVRLQNCKTSCNIQMYLFLHIQWLGPHYSLCLRHPISLIVFINKAISIASLQLDGANILFSCRFLCVSKTRQIQSLPIMLVVGLIFGLKSKSSNVIMS